jgi:Tfp pilus assembly protein PilV
MKRQPPIGSRARSRLGYSLIEVMVASLVLVLVFLSCMVALQSAFRMVDNARMANLADQTIQSQIESIKLLNYSYIGGTPTVNASGNWYFQSKAFTTNLTTATTTGSGWIDFLPQIRSVVGNVNSNQLLRVSRFRMSIVNSLDPTTGAVRTDVKRIKVEMQWRGLRGGQLFSREFETFYAKDGASDYYYTSFN